MEKVTWEDFIHTEFIGGDIQFKTNFTYRGRVAQVNNPLQNILTFELAWCARMNPDTGEWQTCRPFSQHIDKTLVTPWKKEHMMLLSTLEVGVLFVLFSNKHNGILHPKTVGTVQSSTYRVFS